MKKVFLTLVIAASLISCNKLSEEARVNVQQQQQEQVTASYKTSGKKAIAPTCIIKHDTGNWWYLNVDGESILFKGTKYVEVYYFNKIYTNMGYTVIIK